MEKTKIAIVDWIKDHKIEFFLLVVVLFIGAFLRLYRISEYMTFLGDEGRDAIIVRNLLVHADPILIGPGTSIGNMYLGPLYYYLIAPFLFLFNFSPVGPSVLVALFGIATVFLVWMITREWFPSTRSGQLHIGALVAAFLFAISPIVIIYNRSSWNPNVMPFFSLLCIYSAWKIYKDKGFKWFIVLGISFAFVMQTHYLGLILAPIVGLVVFITYLIVRRMKTDPVVIHSFWKYSLLGLLCFLFLMSPLVIFDARHGWMNFGAIKTFFTVRQDTVSAKPWSSIPKLWPLWEQINTRLLGGTESTAGRWVAFGLLDGTLALLVMKWWRKKQIPKAYWLLTLWILVSLFGLAAYKHELYDHYFGFLFAAPFLLLGGLTQDVIDVFGKREGRSKLVAYMLLFGSVIALIVVNVRNNPLHYPPNRQLQRSVVVSAKIIEEAKAQKLNLAVIAERNYEGAYQYFLEKEPTGFIKIEPQDTANTIAEQLFVVCELSQEKCDPTHNPKAEVANFGWSEIQEKWNVEGVILFKLKHSVPATE